jgi:hypothetical protein
MNDDQHNNDKVNLRKNQSKYKQKYFVIGLLALGH